jgi:uncharacterized membrane protein
MLISNLHPMLVHLPIALLSASFLFDLLGHLAGRAELQRTGWWTLLVGSCGLLATVISGLLAGRTVSIPLEAREHFETHEQMAFLVAALYAAALLWRVANRTNLPKGREWLYLVLSFTGVGLMWVAGWYGGELVFRFGVGVLAK